jgi:hypothetical protein
MRTTRTILVITTATWVLGIAATVSKAAFGFALPVQDGSGLGLADATADDRGRGRGHGAAGCKGMANVSIGPGILTPGRTLLLLSALLTQDTAVGRRVVCWTTSVGVVQAPWGAVSAEGRPVLLTSRGSGERGGSERSCDTVSLVVFDFDGYLAIIIIIVFGLDGHLGGSVHGRTNAPVALDQATDALDESCIDGHCVSSASHLIDGVVEMHQGNRGVEIGTGLRPKTLSVAVVVAVAVVVGAHCDDEVTAVGDGMMERGKEKQDTRGQAAKISLHAFNKETEGTTRVTRDFLFCARNHNLVTCTFLSHWPILDSIRKKTILLLLHLLAIPALEPLSNKTQPTWKPPPSRTCAQLLFLIVVHPCCLTIIHAIREVINQVNDSWGEMHSLHW